MATLARPVTIGDKLEGQLDAIAQGKEESPILILRFEDLASGKLDLEHAVEMSMSADSPAKIQALVSYIESSNENASAFCLLKVEEKGWVFVSYIPDTAKVKEKMVYASSREKVKKELSLISDEYHAAGIADINDEILVEKKRKPQKGGGGNARSAENKPSTESSTTFHGIVPNSYTGGGGIGGAALPFGSGVSEELEELRALPDKDQAMVLKVREGELVIENKIEVEDDSFEKLASQLQDKSSSSISPEFIALKFRKSLSLLLHAPSTSKASEKMKISLSRHSVRESLGGSTCRLIEGDSIEELVEKLEDKIASSAPDAEGGEGEGEEAPKDTDASEMLSMPMGNKPRRPGRGGSKIIRKQ